jgi:hypothetical protein
MAEDAYREPPDAGEGEGYEPGGWACWCGSYNEGFRCHCGECGAPAPWGCDCGLDDEDDPGEGDDCWDDYPGEV